MSWVSWFLLICIWRTGCSFLAIECVSFLHHLVTLIYFTQLAIFSLLNRIWPGFFTWIVMLFYDKLHFAPCPCHYFIIIMLAGIQFLLYPCDLALRSYLRFTAHKCMIIFTMSILEMAAQSCCLFLKVCFFHQLQPFRQWCWRVRCGADHRDGW